MGTRGLPCQAVSHNAKDMRLPLMSRLKTVMSEPMPDSHVSAMMRKQSFTETTPDKAKVGV